MKNNLKKCSDYHLHPSLNDFNLASVMYFLFVSLNHKIREAMGVCAQKFISGKLCKVEQDCRVQGKIFRAESRALK